jgi:hypothetical protein
MKNQNDFHGVRFPVRWDGISLVDSREKAVFYIYTQTGINAKKRNNLGPWIADAMNEKFNRERKTEKTLVDRIRAYGKKVLSSKKAAIESLQKAGICDKKGKLTKYYKP